MAEIIPAIIPKDFRHLREQVGIVKDLVNTVQIDICDGIFVKNQSWPYRGDEGEFEQLSREEIGLPCWEDVNYEFHLMIADPEATLEEWIALGATSIVVHIEAVKNMELIIDMCRGSEVKIGLAIKPSTPLSALAPYGEQIDCIQCMGSDDIGHHGAELDKRVVEKIRELRDFYPEMPIAIDIGVTEESAQELVDAGATRLVSTTAIYDSGHIEDTISYFRGL